MWGIGVAGVVDQLAGFELDHSSSTLAAMSTATAWSDDHFVAGDLALDFANTVYRRTPSCCDHPTTRETALMDPRPRCAKHA